MSADLPPITEVTGGSHGMTVACDHALDLATDYDRAAHVMREWAGRNARVLLDRDLLESAVLSPASFAEAEAQVLAATSGPDGVLVAAAAWEADAMTLRVAVRATQLTDELVARAWESLDQELGYVAGYGISVSAPFVAWSGAGLYLLWSQLPAETQAELATQGLEGLQAWANEHPELLQHLANGSGGLLEGLWDGLTPLTPDGPFGGPLQVPDNEHAAGLLAALYNDGHAVTTPTTSTVPGSGAPPADLAGLLDHLVQVADVSGSDPEQRGTIEVQTIRADDGSVRHIVYLPGTDDLTTTPWDQDGDVRDLGTNLLLASGQPNAYQQGVLDAMHQAGIQPGEPVALVGHSQGGMAAAAILSQGSPYSVTHVVTAGAPTAHLDGFPAGSHVISLENHGDVVPLVDGGDNPDSAEQVTVRFDDHETSIAGNHELDHYVAGAQALQVSGDPSIQDQLASLAEAGFLAPAEGQEATSQVFQITRAL